MNAMTHFWRWRKWLPERYGQHCGVIARGALGSVLVEFADGWRVVTSRWAIRLLPPGEGEGSPG